MRSWRGVSGAAVLVVALAACSDDEWVVEPGQLEFYDMPARIQAPTTAQVSEPVIVRLETYGGGCIEFASMEVTISATAADMRPLDRRLIPGDDGGCILILTMIAHEATLTFDTPGVKTVTVHGRRVNGRGDEPVAFPLTITVE